MDGANEFQTFSASCSLTSRDRRRRMDHHRDLHTEDLRRGLGHDRGQFGTHVIATQFYRNPSPTGTPLGSAIAIVLLLAVVPVMIYNLRQFREREAF